jgi:hypothetical protein
MELTGSLTRVALTITDGRKPPEGAAGGYLDPLMMLHVVVDENFRRRGVSNHVNEATAVFRLSGK